MVTAPVGKLPYMTKTPGQIIKEAREAQGMTQSQLATAIGKVLRRTISRAAIAQWENGTSKTQRPENLMAAADVLGIDLRSAIRGISQSPQVAVLSSRPASRAAIAGRIQPAQDPIIAQVVALMEKTDATGRAMALGAVRAALNGYKPAKANPAS